MSKSWFQLNFNLGDSTIFHKLKPLSLHVPVLDLRQLQRAGCFPRTRPLLLPRPCLSLLPLGLLSFDQQPILEHGSELSVELLVRRICLEQPRTPVFRSASLHSMRLEDDAKNLDVDIDNLRRVGREQGFPPRLRKKIWPALLQINADKVEVSDEAEPHPEEKQVLLDTRRSFTGCLPAHISKESVPRLKDDLQYVISQVLRRNRWLNYYQGYHDIAQLVLLTVGHQQAVVVLERISVLYLRDFMLSTLSPSMSMLRMVHQIISIADPEYADLLHNTEPYYAIPALLTWWTHSLDSYSSACRLVDFLLSTEPVMIVYTIAATTMTRKKTIVGCDLDQDMIFMTLSKGLAESEVEEVLLTSWGLYESIKPKQLRHWRNISQHSCLKTFSMPPKMEDESLELWLHSFQVAFEAQEVELKKEEARKTLQGKAAVPSREILNLSILALSVGVLAVGIAWYMQQR